MVCLRLKSGVAGWKAFTNPLSYGSTPFKVILNVTIKFENKLSPIFEGIINPWTGEAIKLSEDQDDSSAHEGKSSQLCI